MRYFLVSISFFLVFVACTTQAPKKSITSTPNTKEVSVVANDSVILYVEGMVCKMGCGGSIRKELKNTHAVEKCSFDFEEDRKENTATIYFDSTKISVNSIIKHIESLNDKQFKAHI